MCSSQTLPLIDRWPRTLSMFTLNAFWQVSLTIWKNFVLKEISQHYPKLYIYLSQAGWCVEGHLPDKTRFNIPKDRKLPAWWWLNLKLKTELYRQINWNWTISAFVTVSTVRSFSARWTNFAYLFTYLLKQDFLEMEMSLWLNETSLHGSFAKGLLST